MPGVLSTSVQRPFSFVPLVGSLFTKAKPARDRLLSPASPWHPYLYSPPLPPFDLSLLSLVSLLISKDVDFAELPRIPRGFLKRRHYCGCSQYTMFRQEERRVLSYAQTLLIFNPGRAPSFARDPWSTASTPVSLSHTTSSASTNRKITK